jgi:hypothetical protein
MTIKVRERKPNNGISKLYLDIYNPKAEKRRTSLTLDLFVYKNPTSLQRKSNKESLEAAERIRARRIIEMAYEYNGLNELSGKEVSAVKWKFRSN